MGNVALGAAVEDHHIDWARPVMASLATLDLTQAYTSSGTSSYDDPG